MTDHAHAPNWRKWLGHLAGKPNVQGLEIGVFKGESAEWMLENIFTHDTARYACVDTWTGGAEHVRDGDDMEAVRLEALARVGRFYPRSVLFQESSESFLARCRFELIDECGQFDFLYIDGAHDAQNVLRDAVLGWECLKVGGVMIFDDYLWEDMPDALDRPRRAIDAFWNCYQRQAQMLSVCNEWQVALKKIA